MTDQKQKEPDQGRDKYTQFLIALALGAMISVVGLFFFEYFGLVDVVTCWP